MAGDSSSPPGLSPVGTMKKGDCIRDCGCDTVKLVGRFSHTIPLPCRLPSSSAALGGGSGGLRCCCAAAAATGDIIAPARSCEKDLHSFSGSSLKKLETSVMEPGLTSAPPRKRLSTVERGGTDIVGRCGAVTALGSAAPPSSAMAPKIGGTTVTLPLAPLGGRCSSNF